MAVRLTNIVEGVGRLEVGSRRRFRKFGSMPAKRRRSQGLDGPSSCLANPRPCLRKQTMLQPEPRLELLGLPEIESQIDLRHLDVIGAHPDSGPQASSPGARRPRTSLMASIRLAKFPGPDGA